jgi:putative hemolysin
MNISNGVIESLYTSIKDLWEKYLKDENVKLPSLKRGSSFSKDALVLTYLYKKIEQIVSKEELTNFIKKYYPDTNDVQQARHLAAQFGWYIISGTRHDFEAKERKLKSGDYMLITLEKPYPGFTHRRRFCGLDGGEWNEIKEHYGNRCAMCGSKEGEANIHYPSSITILQKGHIDPLKPLELGNIIPQCEKCNRPDRNYFVYDKKGRVSKVADPKFILKSDKEVQKKILEILSAKFQK